MSPSARSAKWPVFACVSELCELHQLLAPLLWDAPPCPCLLSRENCSMVLARDAVLGQMVLVPPQGPFWAGCTGHEHPFGPLLTN